ncbi:hypothetical protein TSOC_014369, partial [Tetrabaena socialis]
WPGCRTMAGAKGCSSRLAPEQLVFSSSGMIAQG